MKSIQLRSADRVWLHARTRHRLVCCQCFAVHDFRFDTLGAGVDLQMWANPGATAEERRKARRARKKK